LRLGAALRADPPAPPLAPDRVDQRSHTKRGIQ
jgi:hypothetical protein